MKGGAFQSSNFLREKTFSRKSFRVSSGPTGSSFVKKSDDHDVEISGKFTCISLNRLHLQQRRRSGREQENYTTKCAYTKV